MLAPYLRQKSIWSYNPSPTGCVLYLPLWHPNLSGPVFKDISTGGHTATVTTATWTTLGRDFESGTPDYIEVPAATLNFIAGAFSINMWVNFETVSANQNLICRGLTNTDGWRMIATSTDRLQFFTFQAAAEQNSFTDRDLFATGTWYHFGVTRSGTSVKLYINGAANVSGVGSHTNPKTSARTVKIGVYDDKSTNPFDGVMGEISVNEGAFSAEGEADYYNKTKFRYT